jgi:hypothetical protein
LNLKFFAEFLVAQGNFFIKKQTLYSMTQDPVQSLQWPLEAHSHVAVDWMVAMQKGKFSAFYTALCCIWLL